MRIQNFLSKLANHIWYESKDPHLALRLLELIFSKAVNIRRRAYRSGHKKHVTLDVPIIAVGNITVGGTGKTPLTIWIANYLKSQGYQPGIVSRGYGGRGQKSPSRVYPDSAPHLVGDEPVLIAKRTQCPVCIFKLRSEAALLLIDKAGCDVIIADDSLQHYSLNRDIEIALVDGGRRFGNGHMLPAGPLREPIDRLSQVDMIVQNQGSTPIGYPMTLTGERATNLLFPERSILLQKLSSEQVHAMAGIANPKNFFEFLRNKGLECTEHSFPDHYDYKPEDLSFAKNDVLLMTEKDAVKCSSFAAENHWYLPIDANLPHSFGPDLLKLLATKSNG